MTTKRIDAHQHFWALSRGEYDWITPEMTSIYRDFLPRDLVPLLVQEGFDGSIVVQAAPTIAETGFMLEQASACDEVLGVVGWLDFNKADYREQLASFQQHPKFVGIRVMIQEMEDSDEVLAPHYIKALTHLAEIGLPVDLLCKSSQLHSVIALLEAVPGLHAVIDHIAKPQIKDQLFEPWKSQLTRIAQFPQVYCKLSGMVTEADHESWKPTDLAPYIQFVIELFGKDRILFGSDWPVCLLAAQYGEVVKALNETLDDSWTETDRAKLFGGNAARFYRIGSE